MRIKAAASFLAFAAMIAFALVSFKSIGVELAPSSREVQSQTRLSMDVNDISGLVVGSSVQLRGVPIGKVTDIATTTAGATVDFYVSDHYKIPLDTDVRLESLSALGEAYIELVPRRTSGPVMQNGQRLGKDSITQPPTISELATTVVRVLNQFDPEALKRIIHEADVGLPNPTDVLPNLSRTAMLVRNTVANMNGKGRDLLDNFQALLRNAQFVGPVLAYNTPYLTKMGVDMASLNEAAVVLHDRGAPQTLHNLSHLVGRIEHFMDHSSGDIKVLTQTMLPYLNDISGALMNLDTGQLFNNALAAIPEDGAVTLHVTVPDTGTPAVPPVGDPATAPTAAAADPSGPLAEPVATPPTTATPGRP